MDRGRNHVVKSLRVIMLSFICVITIGCGSKEREKADLEAAVPSGEHSSEETVQPPIFKIKMLKIGKADTALLYMEGETEAVVIDAGEDDDGPEIAETLEKLGITRIGHLIITHYDKDHMGGAAYILEHIPVGQVIQPGYPKAGDRYEDYRKAVEAYAGDVCTVSEDMEFAVGSLSLAVYSENDPENRYFEEGEDNDRSLVTMISYQSKKFLFTGDIEEKRIRLMLDSGIDLSCDWVKIPHHGDFNSETEYLLKAAGAKDAVICCSEKNPAREETVDAVRQAGMNCWLTADGDITFICDGQNIYAYQE